MLKLQETKDFNEQILVQAAQHCQANDRIPEAIKLYNLAGGYSTVISCLAQALGNTLAQPSGEGQKGRAIQQTAVDILRHYEKTNRAVGKDREAVTKLLRVRDALDAKSAGRFDVALDVSGASCRLYFLAQLTYTDSGIYRSHPIGWGCCQDHSSSRRIQRLA